jgi:hypothetical protein
MPLLSQLPGDLENVEALLKRRERAKTRKDSWRSIYQDAYRFALPARETFGWQTEGAPRNNELYDTTLQDLTYTSANTMLATLFPPWTRWGEFAPGAAIPKKTIDPEERQALQDATETFFGFLHSSNFANGMSEVALDLQIGTGALTFDEGDDDEPFRFTSVPVSALELEEGPNGNVETKFMCREPQAQNLLRMYPGMELFDLPEATRAAVMTTPEQPVKVLQCEVYYPQNKHYYGIVIDETSKSIIWRFDYEESCPTIVARSSRTPGEIYGRGRVLLALSDAKTLDKMVEFVLRHAALQVAPPLTGVTDGVLNPYTAVLAPMTILPVASNDNGNPSLRVLEMGGNFNITEALMEQLRDSIRQKMMGPARSDGAIKSATEIDVSDRDRLWAMGGEYGRIQYELLTKIMARGAFILQRRGLIPKFKVDGRMVAVRYTSPFAKSQAQEDIQALQRTIMLSQLVDPQGTSLGMGLKIEDVPAWVARKEGLDEELIRTPDEKKEVADTATKVVSAAEEADAEGEGQPPQGA